jgi:hypothetical protein
MDFSQGTDITQDNGAIFFRILNRVSTAGIRRAGLSGFHFPDSFYNTHLQV